jgi:dipeptidyl aminopeptidase/acylaminoacyl peptidase
VADGDLTAPRRVTDLSPGVTRLALGRTRLVRWTTARGDTLRGALLLPSDYVAGHRYPLIVRVYGGASLSGTVHRFGLMAGVDNHQMFATRGYAVLLPDTPLRVGTPLADLAADVLPGVDSVIASGIADPDRLGLIGHSYGGWSVLALLVQTGRFRAAVASGSMSDLFADYAHMRPDGSAPSIGWAERDQGRMGATPWEARDRYLANSPFFLLDHVTTPLLLVHGAADNTVPVALAEETFVALRRLGKPVVLVEYDGEEHHQAGWRVANVHDYWARVLDWFGRYLAPTRVVGRTPEGR